MGHDITNVAESNMYINLLKCHVYHYYLHINVGFNSLLLFLSYLSLWIFANHLSCSLSSCLKCKKKLLDFLILSSFSFALQISTILFALHRP